jgi:hypothetical protein
VERHDANNAARNRFRHGLRLAAQCYAAFVERQAIEARTELRREGLQPVKRPFLVEGEDIAFQRGGCAEDTGTAARAFVVMLLVRREIGAEEECRIARNGGLAQRRAMMPAFRDRQAVCMRPQPP